MGTTEHKVRMVGDGRNGGVAAPGDPCPVSFALAAVIAASERVPHGSAEWQALRASAARLLPLVRRGSR